jgi:hypothetical protein
MIEDPVSAETRSSVLYFGRTIVFLKSFSSSKVLNSSFKSVGSDYKSSTVFVFAYY